MKNKSILKALYFGDFDPADQFCPKGENYGRVRQKHFEHYNVFLEKLKKLDETLAEEFLNLYDEMYLDIPYENEAAFAGGVYFGVKLMTEVLDRGGEDVWE